MNTYSSKVKNKSQMEVFSTVSSLKSILKIFGLSCTSRDQGQLKSSYFNFRVAFILIILFLFNILSVYYKLLNNQHNSKYVFTFQDSLQLLFLFGYIQYVMDVYYVNKHGSECYLKYMRLYEYIDKILGITSYKNITKSINKTCAFFIIIAFSSCIANYIIWSICYGWVAEVKYIIDYIYIFFKVLRNLDFISNCTQVRYRLKKIGEKVKDFYYHMNNLSGIGEDLILYKFEKKINGNKRQIDLNNSNVRHLRHDIMQLNRCYLLLNEQCDYINTLFGYRILLCSINFLIDITNLMSFMMIIIVGKLRIDHNYQYLIAIGTAMQLISGYMIIIYGLHCCEQNYREAERILKLIDHIQINKTIDQEVRDSVEELRHLIITRPIKYHAANFFKVEYPSLVSVVSIIVTYSILLEPYVKDW